MSARENIEKHLGGAKLWALVNNAGIGFKTGGEGPGETIVQTNFWGTVRVTEHFLSLLSGRIVNVGSGVGCMWLNKQE